MDNLYEIIVWPEGRTTGDRFANQSADTVMRVSKHIEAGTAFALSRESHGFTLFGPGKVNYIQVTQTGGTE